MKSFTSVSKSPLVTDADIDIFRASGRFDENWYVSEYPDVAKTGMDPALHYLWIGRRLGRAPSSQTNSHYEIEGVETDALVQNLSHVDRDNTVGSFEKISIFSNDQQIQNLLLSRSLSLNNKFIDLIYEYFDDDFYLSTYPDVDRQGLEPLRHYIEHGEKEGRRPNKHFYPKEYLSINQDVAKKGVSPLIHYLMHGRHEGRLVVRPTVLPIERVRPVAPSLESFQKIARIHKNIVSLTVPETSIVDVIIPVYRGYSDTLACIYSLLIDNVKTSREIIVINDCSPEPELTDQLRYLASIGLFTLLENEQNLGFVGTVNRGMQLHPHRDVLLLNSDTEVYNDWLDRLVLHGKIHRVASVTPFSNNATICSYPKFIHDNPVAMEIDYAEIDRISAACNLGNTVEVPTGVGFCMYIQRSAIDALGLFNFDEFAKGYGEENDFCMRAKNEGWTNLMALDVFVRHTGETSFAEVATASQKRGLDTVVRLHPTYPEVVQEFIRRDPARIFRQRLDIERLKKAVPGDDRVLCLTHNWGGGILRYIKDRAIEEQQNGRGLLVCEPKTVVGEGLHLHINTPQHLMLDNLVFSAAGFDNNSEFISVLRELNIRKIEVHSLVGWPFAALDEIPKLASTLGLTYEVMLHDYTPICPQTNLTDASDIYCGERGLSQCITCVASKKDPSRFIHPRSGVSISHGRGDNVDVAIWRHSYGKLLLGASRAVAPARDVADRFVRYIPDLKIEVVEHSERLPTFAKPLSVPFSPGGLLRVALIGAIGPHKGSNVLKAIALEAKESGRKIEYIVIGYTNNDEHFKSIGNVSITGAYQEDEVYKIIREQKCHVALLPSVWPETFSYTLSIASTAKIPTLVFDIGAQGERAKLLQYVRALPFSMVEKPVQLNEELARWALDCMHTDKIRYKEI